jgi:predicted RecA/RadA family phage recombinase
LGANKNSMVKGKIVSFHFNNQVLSGKIVLFGKKFCRVESSGVILVVQTEKIIQ